ncbi:MAG TPA: hypothetical protein VG032_12120 [Acidimicrobiales bacterium]|jgi:hypothetical protein|nr:hypothetical protein [Acidimicrobiales bacterium]
MGPEQGSNVGRRSRGGGRGRAAPPPGSGEAEGQPGDVVGWLAGRLPSGWFEGPPTVTVDRDEIVIVGRVAAPDLAEGDDESARSAGEAGRMSRFREETRPERMAIAREAERLFGRCVAWGAEVGDTSVVFTNLSVPVMTRLRQPERRVLDTLVDSGVARSRSDALAWCVKLVATHADEWLQELRAAMETVESVRQQGPPVV